MEGQKLWNNILVGIKSQISSSTFKTWFLGSFVLDYKKNDDKNLLIVAVKNNFLKEQVETRYRPIIAQVAKERGFAGVEVVFVVSQKETPRPLRSEPLFSGVAQKLVLFTRKAEILNPQHTFENFIVGFSNNLAYVAATQVAENVGSSYNPLMFYGPTGVGKTHLLQAVGNEVLNRTVEAKVLYVTAEKFTNDFIESLHNKTTHIFRQKYRSVDILLVDDIQFFAGKESTQDEFFHTFNELCLSCRQIVLACDRHPRELGKLRERLVSRFLGGMAVDIGVPDLEMKMAILKVKCLEKGVHLDNEIVSYIAGSCQGGARELEGVLVSVLALMKLSGEKITLEKIKATVARGGQIPSSLPDAAKIAKTIADYFKEGIEEIRGPKRKVRLVFARQILMYFLRKVHNMPLSEIGGFVGNRDHSTVIHGIQKIEASFLKDRKVRDEILRIQAVLSV